SNDVSEVNRLLAEFYNALVKQNLDVNPEDYSSKIDDISTTGLAIALEAKEIYEANKSILPHRYKDSVGTYVNSFEERRSPGKFNIWNGQEGFNAAQKLLEDVKKLLLELQNLTKNNKPNIQVPKQAPTEAAKPVLSPEALTRLTTWYNQAKDLLKDDQVKDKYVDILAVQKAVDQAYDHVEEGKFITTDQANQLANKLRDALQSLELKDKKVAKPEAKPEVKPEVKPDVKPEAKPATKKSVNTSGNLAAKKAIENKKYSKKLPSTGEAASPLLAIVSLIVMLSA
ncbi:LPXTG cell wall anchor domain-containing protein, partial [Streptococcus agalactiae]|nr:LPXTG cell wall anchor domain-containing protein [Streptococcus agalactiae]